MSVRTSSSGHHSTTRRTGTPPSRSPARAASSRYPLRSPRRAGCLQLRPRPRTPQQHDGGLLGGRLRRDQEHARNAAGVHQGDM